MEIPGQISAEIDMFNALTMNWAGAVATLSLSVLMQFFATPIFIGSCR
jgi:hypothetical protein